MLLPVTHENLRGRRWPWVTTIIIVLNILAFLGTHWTLEREFRQVSQIRLHLLLLSSHYPDVPLNPDAAALVAEFKRQHPDAFRTLGDRRAPIDQWDAVLQSDKLSKSDLEAEANDLASALEEFKRKSFAWTYTYHSHEPTAVSYLTWNFLHGGWLHIIFNMWFLWLAGTIVEETWGRILYPIFYLASGIVAAVVQGAVFPDSFVQCLGASGAIAGLMGAFLARFPTTRIKLMWIWTFGLVRKYVRQNSEKRSQRAIYRWFLFWLEPIVPAYVLLPLWLFIQVFWGALATAGVEQGVAYWAHIGGFAFGMLAAVMLRVSGLEQAADEAIEAKVSWTADPRIVRATEFMAANQYDGAVAEMQQLVKEQSDSIEAHELLLKAQDKKQDVEGQKQTLAALCRIHVAAGNGETAWGYYEQFRNLGGERLPRGVWLALCRYLESAKAWETAEFEYRRFAELNASERTSVSALISAARICLNELNKREVAEALYQEAAASPVEHADLERVIQDGLKECTAAAPKLGTYTAR